LFQRWTGQIKAGKQENSYYLEKALEIAQGFAEKYLTIMCDG